MKEVVIKKKRFITSAVKPPDSFPNCITENKAGNQEKQKKIVSISVIGWRQAEIFETSFWALYSEKIMNFCLTIPQFHLTEGFKSLLSKFQCITTKCSVTSFLPVILICIHKTCRPSCLTIFHASFIKYTKLICFNWQHNLNSTDKLCICTEWCTKHLN